MIYVLVLVFYTQDSWKGFSTQTFKTKAACEKILNYVKSNHGWSVYGTSTCLEVKDE